MRYLFWILRLVIFIIVLLFAMKNTDLVDVGLFAGRVIHQVPLIVVMLVAFALGAIFGLLFAATSVVRRGREISRLKRQLNAAEHKLEQRPAETIITEPVAPL